MPLRLIIVEDDPVVAIWLHDILSDGGHHVVGMATHAEEALRVLSVSKADLAIMDVGLARGANGVDAARMLRERFDLPVLFVSGELNDEVRQRAAPSRPVGFVPKPFTRAEVLSAINAT